VDSSGDDGKLVGVERMEICHPDFYVTVMI
jgi:hypothetical protein